MTQLQVIVRILRENKLVPVEMPDDVPMERIIPALVTKMGLPRAENATPLSYQVYHSRLQRTLTASDTIHSSEVLKDDELVLISLREMNPVRLKNLRVTITTPSEEVHLVELPAYVRITTIMPTLIKQLSLPFFDYRSDDEMILYTFWHESSGRLLDSELTLESEGVQNGDRLDIVETRQPFLTWSWPGTKSKPDHLILYATIHKAGFPYIAFPFLPNPMPKHLYDELELMSYMTGFDILQAELPKETLCGELEYHLLSRFSEIKRSKPCKRVVFFHKRRRKMLQADETLEQARVEPGDVLDAICEVEEFTQLNQPSLPKDTRPKPVPGPKKVLIADVTGAKKTPVEIPDNVAINSLVPALVTKMALPTSQAGTPIDYSLDHKESGRRIGGNETLRDIYVQDGDTLVLLPNVTAGAGIIVNSYRDIQLINFLLNKTLVNSYSKFAVYAIILYTSADKNIANFIQNNFLELHHLSGSTCAFYVVEQPDEKWIASIKKGLSNNFGPYAKQLWKRIDPSRLSPVDRMMAYDIGEHLGVKPSQLPCLVFFTDLESKDVLVVNFASLLRKPVGSADDQELIHAFRTVFEATQKAAVLDATKRLPRLKKEIVGTSNLRAAREKVLTTFTETTLQESIKALIDSIVKALIM